MVHAVAEGLRFLREQGSSYPAAIRPTGWCGGRIRYEVAPAVGFQASITLRSAGRLFALTELISPGDFAAG